MPGTRTLKATEFKAKCLDILDRVASREFDRVVITKRGVAVAVLTPPPSLATEIQQLPGFLRDSVVIPPGLDLTAPVLDEAFAAQEGDLHR